MKTPFLITRHMKNSIESINQEPGALTAREMRYLIGRDDPVILEIGANSGQSTKDFLKEMPKSRIYCFEPDPRAINEFHAAIKNPNVTLIESAVGAENGSVIFHQSSGDGEFKDWNLSGSIREPHKHFEVWPTIKFNKKIEVPIIRLDDWVASQGLDVIDFIWADVQGAEGDLISGGLQTINKARYFYTEYGRDEFYKGQINLMDLYDSLDGFSLTRLFEWDALFENMNLTDLMPYLEKDVPKLSRNERCLCGSGKKYKECHGILV